MKRSLAFLACLIAALTILGCSDHPVVGGRVAEAQGSSLTAQVTQVAPVARRIFSGTDGNLPWSPSPDGRLWVRSSVQGILVRDVTTGVERVVIKPDGPFPSTPRFSADGQRLEYSELAQRPDDVTPPFVLKWAVRSVNLDGSAGPTLLKYEISVPSTTPNFGVALQTTRPLTWTHDGQHVVLGTNIDTSRHRIAVLSTNDNRVRTLKSFDWRAPGDVRFSPDGGFIAYDFQPDEKSADRDVYLMAVDGSRESVVASNPADDRVIDWTLDGRLLLVSDRSGTTGVYVTTIVNGRAQGEPQLIKADLHRYTHAVGVGSNGSVYYGVQPTGNDVHTATLDSATLKVLSPPTSVAASAARVNYFASWSPDGRTFAYVTQRVPQRIQSGQTRVVLRSIDTGDVHELAPDLQYFSFYQWFPDSQSLIVRGRDTHARPGFFRFDVRTGAVTPLWLEPTPPDYFKLSKDGATLWFPRPVRDEPETPAARGRMKTRIMARDLATGVEREVARLPETVMLVVPSPDNSRVAFVTDSTAEARQLVVMTVSGGEPAVVYRAPSDRTIRPGAVVWDGTDKLLFTTRKRPTPGAALRDGDEVWRIELNSGALVKSELAWADGIAGLLLHPDGRRVAFESGQPSFEIWALDNALPAIGRR